MYLELNSIYLEHINKDFLKAKFDEMLSVCVIDFYAFILHDKDLTIDNQIKKAHYHIIIDFKTTEHRSVDHAFSKCDLLIKLFEFMHNKGRWWGLP